MNLFRHMFAAFRYLLPFKWDNFGKFFLAICIFLSDIGIVLSDHIMMYAFSSLFQEEERTNSGREIRLLSFSAIFHVVLQGLKEFLSTILYSECSLTVQKGLQNDFLNNDCFVGIYYMPTYAGKQKLAGQVFVYDSPRISRSFINLSSSFVITLGHAIMGIRYFYKMQLPQDTGLFGKKINTQAYIMASSVLYAFSYNLLLSYTGKYLAHNQKAMTNEQISHMKTAAAIAYENYAPIALANRGSKCIERLLSHSERYYQTAINDAMPQTLYATLSTLNHNTVLRSLASFAILYPFFSNVSYKLVFDTGRHIGAICSLAMWKELNNKEALPFIDSVERIQNFVDAISNWENEKRRSKLVVRYNPGPRDDILLTVQEGTKINRPDGTNIVHVESELKFQYGKFYSVLGQSGEGKSSLLRCICRTNHANIIWPYGEGTIDFYINQSEIFTIPQNPYLFSADGTIWGAINVLTPGAARHDVIGLMNQCGLTDKVAQLDEVNGVSNLSGGEKQRFMAVAAVVAQPKLLIMDEAFSALDQTNKRTIQNLMKERLRKTGTTVISVEHNVGRNNFYDEYINIRRGYISMTQEKRRGRGR